ncbi:MAG: 6-phosphofructokinase, partial [Fusobacteriaceae bacterium]
MRIGVLTSGGDAPGMNAVIRAIVKVAHSYGIEVFGIKRGFVGLIENQIAPLTLKDVDNIAEIGGSILK